MTTDDLRDQLDSLHAISVEIAALHDIGDIHDRALDYCLELTASQFGFTGLLVDEPRGMDIAAVKGFAPIDREFYEQFHLMAVRPSVVGMTIQEERPHISNDVLRDPDSVGQPPGHPPVLKFLGVPLRIGERMIGMIGVANKTSDYGDRDERILSTFANQVAVAIENARLYERQREMISSLQQMHERLSEAERSLVLDRERKRIAGRLHDQIEQQIFSIGLGINSLLDVGSVDPASGEQLRALRQIAVATADEVRGAIFALTTPGHGSADIVTAVRALLRDLEQRSELATNLVVSGTVPDGLEPIQDALVSVIAEALTNVERHARARTILVSFRFADDRFHVVIQDDGEGIPQLVLHGYSDSYLHFGLRHMRQQVLDLGGSFDVGNGEEAGTVIHISVPLPDQAP